MIKIFIYYYLLSVKILEAHDFETPNFCSISRTDILDVASTSAKPLMFSSSAFGLLTFYFLGPFRVKDPI